MNRGTTLALCLLSLGITSYAQPVTTLSTGLNTLRLECPDVPECNECPECNQAVGLSIVVADGLELQPGRYRILFAGSRAFFDVVGPALGPGVHRIARLSDTPSCPEPECGQGLRLQVDSAVDEERVQRIAGMALPGSFRRGVLLCEQQEVWP